MTVGLARNPLTPIILTCMKLYDLNGSWLMLSTSISFLATVLMSIPALQISRMAGVKVTVITGALLITLGFSLRILVNEGVKFVLIGQAIAGLGCPLVITPQAKIIETWFSSKD